MTYRDAQNIVEGSEKTQQPSESVGMHDTPSLKQMEVGPADK